MKRRYTITEMAEWYAQAVRDYEAAIPVVLHVGRVLQDTALSGDVDATLALAEGDWRKAIAALRVAKNSRCLRPLGPLTGNWDSFQATAEQQAAPKTGICDMSTPSFPDLEAKLAEVFDAACPPEPRPEHESDMQLDAACWEEQLERDCLRRAQADASWKLAENQRLARRQQFVHAGTALARAAHHFSIPL